MTDGGAAPTTATRERTDPWAAPRWLREPERRPDGGLDDALAVFLVGSRCPFRCVYCDLGRGTLDRPTPVGALPHQLRAALGAQPSPPDRVKLYNASNLFEARAVPPEDDRALAEALAGIRGVTAECHPRLVGDRCWRFADRLDGRLEVAMGLETIHPEALPRLGKEMSLADFERAAAEILERDLELRVFVLVGPPFVPPEEHVEWAVRSARWSLARGARHVTLVPTRPGTAALDDLALTDAFTPPTLDAVEEVALALVAGRPAGASSGGVVTVDLWDLERFAACRACFPARRDRLARLNLEGAAPRPTEPCEACGWRR